MYLSLKSPLQKLGFQGKLLAHVMGWFGDGVHINRMNRYKSNDQYVIARQLDCMQHVGIDGVIVTWQGPLVPYVDITARTMVVECGERNMLFALCIDPWCAKLGQGTSTQNVVTALNNVNTKNMISTPAYLPEKYVLDFNTGADLSVLATTFPNLKFLGLDTGFSWIGIPSGSALTANATAVSGLATHNANPLMKIPGLCRNFNDSGMPTPAGVTLANWTGTRDYNQTVWGGGPERILDAQGGHFFYDQLGVTPVTTVPYVALVTWNDYDEGTELESFCSMATGIQI